MLIPILWLLAGLGVLLLGGDVFVRGSASIAKKMRVSPIVIGLTVVAFGTSAPEMVVNIFSAVGGAPDIAVGNVIGSNISNILLVLGVAAMIHPLAVKKGTAWKEIPFSVLTIIVLYLLASDMQFGAGNSNLLSRADGLVLMSFFAIFLYYTYGLTKIKGPEEKVETYGWGRSWLYVLGGIIGLVLGGKLMVDNGVILARMAGMSELLIGLTITAVGTSLPELVTSAIAAYKKHVDIAIGNVVGSNIFNILWVLGLTPVISPIQMGDAVSFDILICIAVALLLFAFLFIGKKHTIGKWQGVLFVCLYILYTGFILFRG